MIKNKLKSYSSILLFKTLKYNDENFVVENF
jgi:hypothetical protein